ncbi:DUF1963 domain-containing protein [Yoonia sp. R2-816]|uniref:DUF1963 domain-containing protein n=1 Tax=Yoonia sp. R2-816 TaxID=3342638 RepID=UPI00372B0DC4
MSGDTFSHAEIDGYLSRIRQQAAVLLRTTNQTDLGMPGCWFGGEPSLPADIEWPVYNCPWPKVVIPMHFIFQINLRYVPKSLGFPDYPDTGILFVFVEPILASEDESSPISPLLTGQCARVIYIPEDVSRCRPRKAPPLPDLDEEHPPAGTIREAIQYEDYLYMRETYGVTTATGLHRWPMNFVVVDTYPEHDIIKMQNPSQDVTTYESKELRYKTDALNEKVLDECSFYQLDREKENGDLRYLKVPHWMFGSPRSHQFPSKEAIKNADADGECPRLTEQHIVLFRLLSDDPNIGYSYRNLNNLVFWINKQDLAFGNFDNILIGEEF